MFLIAILVAPFAQVVAAEELPGEAQKIINEFDKAASSIRLKADNAIKPFRANAVKRLKALQDKYCRAAKLDEALAIREAIRQIKGIHPDPGLLRAKPEQVGQVFLYEVTGNLKGSVWGTEVYTSDSHLATAAVHAGLLDPGQTGNSQSQNTKGPEELSGLDRPWGNQSSLGSLERKLHY